MGFKQYPNHADFIRVATATTQIKKKSKVRGIGVFNDEVYVNLTGSAVRLADTLANANPTTTLNIGAKNGATVSVLEYGSGLYHQTVLTLTATPITVADATAGGGVKLYTFPEGFISIIGGTFSVAPTTTSILASTLHGGVTIDMGVGTASAGAGALTTTEDDIIDSVNGTASATINVAGAAVVAGRTTASAILDGHSAAKTANFNIGVATGSDIDADATLTLTGTVTVIWTFNGDV